MTFDLSKLTTSDLREILEDSGYIASDIDCAKFSHVTNRCAVYTILFGTEEEGVCDTGKVYVNIGPEGKLVADY